MSGDYGAVFRRMMRQLDEDYTTGDRSPRCDGCGRRVELAPYQRRTLDGGREILLYCACCSAQAALEEE